MTERHYILPRGYEYSYYTTFASAVEPSPVIVHVEGVEHFILRTKEKDYVLDFQKLLEDYGIEVKE